VSAEPVALVTGGAGGIGSSICSALADEGFCVAVGYNRSLQPAEQLVKNLSGEGHIAVFAPVTDSQGLSEAARRIASELGGCDVLVNCAGTTKFVSHDDLDGLDDQLFDEIFATNVRGSFASVRATRSMLEKSTLPGGGVVVNISSVAAVTGMGSNIAYCASKAALDNITKSLARALAPTIRVVSVSPGLVDTDFIKSLDQSWRDEQVARTPLHRLASPSDVASAVVSAITQLRLTTGSVLAVDGGRPLA